MAEYAERDAEKLDELGGFYFKHVSAMTGEALHSKSDIAAELAYRDAHIDYLEKKIQSALIAHPNAVPVLLQEAIDRTHLEI
jgi:hypothetical protein